jgi:hypothetical protein
MAYGDVPEQRAASSRQVDKRVETLSSEVISMAADPAVPDSEIIDKLRAMAHNYRLDDILEVVVRFDTPDILG